MTVCAPAISSELPKACQTLGNCTAPRTAPTRERTTDAKSGSTRNMKLRRCRSGPTSRVNAPAAAKPDRPRPKPHPKAVPGKHRCEPEGDYGGDQHEHRAPEHHCLRDASFGGKGDRDEPKVREDDRQRDRDQKSVEGNCPGPVHGPGARSHPFPVDSRRPGVKIDTGGPLRHSQ